MNVLAGSSLEREFAGFTYPRLLRSQVDARATQLAIVTPSRALTWQALDAEVTVLAAALQKLGVKPDDKVAILASNSCDWIAWFHAAAGIGAVVVPVNTRFRKDELAYQLKASDTRVLVMHGKLGETDFLAMLLELVPELRTAAPGAWTSATFPLLRHVVCLEVPFVEASGVWSATDICIAAAPVAVAAVRAAQDAVRPDDSAMIQYTSGTTAFPKGVVLSHYSTARNAYHVNQRLRINADDRIFSPGPFFHVGGSTLGLLLGLLAGATIYALSRFDPEEVLKLVRREKITIYNGVDSLFITLYKHPAFHIDALASVRTGWIASSPEIVRMVQHDMGLFGIVNVFGISEAAPNITICDIDDSIDLRADTCGYPHTGCEVKVVDPASGLSVPAGEPGEILFRGYSLMRGYYNNPVETANAIDAEGWLHTGDLGVLRSTGELEYKGRLKEMLRVGGENIAPAEIEEVLSQHPKVRQVAVVGIPDDRLIEVAAAVLELKPGETCTAEEIVAFCKARLASYKVPRAVAFVESLPMTGSGKIQKFRLVQDVFNLGVTTPGEVASNGTQDGSAKNA
jgi:acyl-CoA synthetase (AMP-forming)/AMP-acid ligase II